MNHLEIHAAYNLIKHYESFRSKAYRCPAGVWTIGYGSTIVGGLPVKQGQTITLPAAESELVKTVETLRKEILIRVRVKLLEHQLQSLISLVYNIGLGNFSGSTILKLLRRGEISSAAEEFPKWNKGRVNGKLQILPGLIKRRLSEQHLFVTGELKLI